MKTLLAALVIIALGGCDMPKTESLDGPKIGGRYQAFEVKEYGLVCVSGGSGQLSCVKK